MRPSRAWPRAPGAAVTSSAEAPGKTPAWALAAIDVIDPQGFPAVVPDGDGETVAATGGLVVASREGPATAAPSPVQGRTRWPPDDLPAVIV